MRGPVLNQFPTAEGSYRIAFIGEAPGADECRLGYPFAGAAGWTLNSALSAVGLRREECLIANICQHRPGASSNDFSLLEWTGDEVQAGIAQLLRDLAQWPPYLVVCLGNVPLHLFRHGNVAPPRTPSGYKWPSKVTQWRGSLFLSHEQLYSSMASTANPLSKSSAESDNSARLNCREMGAANGLLGERQYQLTVDQLPSGSAGSSPAQPTTLPAQAESCRNSELGVGSPQRISERPVLVSLSRHKCLSTWHPAYVNRVWSKMFDLRQDMIRAREEGNDPALTLPELDIACGPAN